GARVDPLRAQLLRHVVHSQRKNIEAAAKEIDLLGGTARHAQEEGEQNEEQRGNFSHGRKQPAPPYLFRSHDQLPDGASVVDNGGRSPVEILDGDLGRIDPEMVVDRGEEITGAAGALDDILTALVAPPD